MLTGFPNRGWAFSGLRNLIKKIDQTRSIDRKSGSDCSRSSIEYVEEEIYVEVEVEVLKLRIKCRLAFNPAEISNLQDISESSV